MGGYRKCYQLRNFPAGLSGPDKDTYSGTECGGAKFHHLLCDRRSDCGVPGDRTAAGGVNERVEREIIQSYSAKGGRLCITA